MSNLKSFEDWKNEHQNSPENESLLFLTPEEVRADPNYSNASDEEVENIIHTLQTLALAAYDVYCNEDAKMDKTPKNKDSEIS